MPTVTMMLPEGELRCEADYTTVTFEDSYYDDWKYTDRHGHQHRYAERATPGEVWRKGKRRRDRPTHFPTLREIIDSRHKCYGWEGLYAHEPHWVEEGHYECRQCGERIEPAHGPVSKPVLTSEAAYLNGELISRERRDELITAEMNRQDEQRRSADAAKVISGLGYPEAFA
jgi:hypothetical protein